MQVAIASFLNDKTGVRVDLVGAIHIGDKAYYDALNKRFKDYDAVLFELVADPRQAKDLAKAKNRKESTITGIQRLMQNGLDLEFQLDAIDYSRPNFIHADMDPKTFDQRRKVRGETMFSLMWKTMQEEMARQRQGHPTPEMSPWDLLRAMLSDNRSLEMKRLLGSQMIQMEGTLAGLDSGEGTVIVNERNDIALDVLKKTAGAGKKRIAIFYGAAHMPDMERKLLKSMGYRSTDRQWITAWNLPKAAPKVAPKPR